MKREMTISSKWLIACVSALLVSSMSYAGHDIRIAAHEVDQASNHVYQQAAREIHGDRNEYYVMRRLSDFATAAEHFHHMVEIYYSNPHHIDHDFRNLENAFYDASDALRYGHFSDHVWRDFYRCEDAMNELRYTFGHGGGHDGGHDRPDRPGRPGRPGFPSPLSAKK